MLSIERNLTEAIVAFGQQAVILRPLFALFGDIAGYIMIVIFIVAVAKITSFKAKSYYFMLAVLSAIISRGIITETINFLMPVERPFKVFGIESMHLADSGFPSGHMALFVPIALTIFSFDKKLGQFMIGGVVLMGISRILLGYHFPSDILGGIVVGLIGFFAAKAILPKKLS